MLYESAATHLPFLIFLSPQTPKMEKQSSVPESDYDNPFIDSEVDDLRWVRAKRIVDKYSSFQIMMQIVFF